MINKKLKYLIILSFFLLPTYNPKVELEFFPIKKRKQASKTPAPPGAVGTIKPIAQDKQKITNK